MQDGRVVAVEKHFQPSHVAFANFPHDQFVFHLAP
jgi:hypothetical protein